MAALDPVDIVCDSHEAFRQIIISSPYAPVGADASPIYQTMNGQVTINGSYFGDVGTAYEDREYIYDNVTLTMVERTRIGLRDLPGGVDTPNYVIDPPHFSGIQTDLLYEGIYDTSEKFIALCGNLPSYGDSHQPFAPPTISESLNHVEADGFDTGEVILESTGTVIKSSASLSISGPFFRNKIEDGDLEMYFRLDGTINFPYQYQNVAEELVINASSWGESDFRDVRGTYTTFSTDSRGMTFDWTVTLA